MNDGLLFALYVLGLIIIGVRHTNSIIDKLMY